MNFFKSLNEFLTDQFDVYMTIRKSDDELIVSITPKPNGETNPSVELPFLVSGNPEQIDNNLIEALLVVKEDINDYLNCRHIQSFPNDTQKNTTKKSLSKRIRFLNLPVKFLQRWIMRLKSIGKNSLYGCR